MSKTAIDPLVSAADVHSGRPMTVRGRVEYTIRDSDDVEFCFIINLTDDPVALAPRGVAVLQRASDSVVDRRWI